MHKSSFAGTIATLAVLGLAPSPTLAQATVDEQLGSVHFETSCNEVAQRRFDRAMRYQHSFWYTHRQGGFEEVLKADPTCAMAQWGIALTLLDNPHNPIPQPNLAPGLAAIQKAKAMGAKTERERDYIDALTADVRRPRQAQPCPAHPRVPRRAGEARGEVSGRRRGADRLRHHAQHLGRPERQDLRPAEQGRRDSRADLAAAAAASGRHALPHPPLRLSGDRREGARRRQPLRQDRAGRAARPAHAVAHLHPRRLLEGVDRLQHRLGEGREGGEVGRQLSARPGLHGLCPPAARPGQAGARRHGRDDAGDRFQGDRLGRRTMRWRPRRRAMRSSAATGTARRNCRSGRAPSTT